MLSGEVPDPELERFFDVCLVLHAEHFVQRIHLRRPGSRFDPGAHVRAVAAGVGALSGELHGGANVRVMEMLLKIGSAGKVADFVDQELDAGRVIFGLGHAVYKVDDPRAHILAPMCLRMGQRSGQPQWFEMSQLLENRARRLSNSAKASIFS